MRSLEREPRREQSPFPGTTVLPGNRISVGRQALEIQFDRLLDIPLRLFQSFSMRVATSQSWNENVLTFLAVTAIGQKNRAEQPAAVEAVG